MVGYVSVRAYSSSKSASQRTLDFVWCAPGLTRTRPRYEARPVPFETDFERIWEVVCGARCVTLAPASWCMPSLAKATERISPRAPGSISSTAGYFMVTFEPRFPSTHSIVASRYAAARFVTRLYTFLDQFW